MSATDPTPPMLDAHLVTRYGSMLAVDLWYPRVDDRSCTSVEVGLMDVRAARDIRIAYDFKRDGYVITADEASGDEDERRAEVAFVPAWPVPK